MKELFNIIDNSASLFIETCKLVINIEIIENSIRHVSYFYCDVFLLDCY
jgi:hypothetical protein